MYLLEYTNLVQSMHSRTSESYSLLHASVLVYTNHRIFALLCSLKIDKMETVFCDLLSKHTHTPFDVLALVGVSGDMLFLVCDDLPAVV